jgi:hypothetical protein
MAVPSVPPTDHVTALLRSDTPHMCTAPWKLLRCCAVAPGSRRAVVTQETRAHESPMNALAGLCWRRTVTAALRRALVHVKHLKYSSTPEHHRAAGHRRLCDRGRGYKRHLEIGRRLRGRGRHYEQVQLQASQVRHERRL